MSRTYLRGDLYYADLGHGIGSEQKGTRPVVIIQNNVGNKYSPTVIIAAITSKANIKAKLPTHYYLDAGNGLTQPSLVLLEQIRTETEDKRITTMAATITIRQNVFLMERFFSLPIYIRTPKPFQYNFCWSLLPALCVSCEYALSVCRCFPQHHSPKAFHKSVPGQRPVRH